MARYALSDPIWEQLQVTMKAKGCHRWPNDREVADALVATAIVHTAGLRIRH